MKQKILLIGASSWIASRFIDCEESQLNELVTVSRKNATDDSSVHYRCDATDFSTMVGIIQNEDPDVIVNFSGAALPDAELNVMMSVNVGITTTIFRALAVTGCEARFVGFGSSAEYGNSHEHLISEESACQPQTGYALTKFQQSVFALSMASVIKNKIILLRPFDLLGSGMPSSMIGSLVWEKAKQCRHKNSLTLFYPDIERDFIDDADAANAVWTIVNANPMSGVYNVCSGKATSLRAIGNSMLSALGFDASVEQDVQYLDKHAEVGRAVGDCKKIFDACGWQASSSIDALFKKMAARIDEQKTSA